MPSGDFFGRHLELAALTERLTSSAARLTTLVGPGGVGKTALAAHAASAAQEHFADGVVTVELASVNTRELVHSVVCHALGVRDAGNRPLLDSLRNHLHGKHLLVVLDNCEHVLAASASIVQQLLQAEGVHVLATSREALGLGCECVYPLGPLALPAQAEEVRASPAVQLFVARARQALATFSLELDEDAQAVADICMALDGLPLAIELAAARVRVLPPRAIRARLANCLDLLSSGRRDVPDRQRTLRATLDWSYALLEPHQQALLRQVAVFAGGFTLESAAAVVSHPAGVLDDVEALVDKGLVRAEVQSDGEPRFRLPETVAQYALERLRESAEERDARARHAAWALELAQAAAPRLAGPEQRQWFDALEREHDNLRAALAWCRDANEPERGSRLAIAVWWFWMVRGYFGDAEQWLEHTWSRERELPATLRVGLLRRAVNVATRRGAHLHVADLLEQCAALIDDVADPVERAEWLQCRARTAVAQGAPAQALPLLEESLHLVQSTGSRLGLASHAYNLGLTLIQMGDVVGSTAALRRCVAESRAIGHHWLVAAALGQLSLLAARQAEWRLATEHAREMLRLDDHVGDRWGMCHALALLGWTASAQGRSLVATRLLSAADAGLRAIGASVWTPSLAMFERLQAGLRESLTETVFEAAWTEAGAWSTERVVEYALAPSVEREPPAQSPERGPLSPRESEVVRLVAAGHTNRQIASTLTLSEKTVSRHLDNIFSKLGISSRAAATAFAIRSGLA